MGSLSPSKPKAVQESEFEKALAETAYKGWQRDKKVGIPQQNKLIKEFEKMDDPANVRMMQGRAAASAAQSIPLMPGNPAMGGSLRMAAQLASRRGAAIGGGMTTAREGAERGRREGLRGMVALGKGIQNRGLQGASQLAQQANAAQQASINANAAREQAQGGLLGIAAGFGINQYLNRGARPSAPRLGVR